MGTPVRPIGGVASRELQELVTNVHEVGRLDFVSAVLEQDLRCYCVNLSTLPIFEMPRQ